MYNIRQLKKGMRWIFKNPMLLLRELNKLYYSIRYSPKYYPRGINIIDEDWDTLIILDACRYDLFEEQNTIEGDLQSKLSKGPHTSQFLVGNFNGREIHDTVYTTASPQLSRRIDRNELSVSFHEVNNIWATEKWDNDEGTVLPEIMASEALAAHKKWPNKRHIVHFMQPHYPFIGSDISNDTRTFNENEGYDIWEAKIRGRTNYSEEEIRLAYRQNFSHVLEAVTDLISKIDGRIVVTSDHGNMIGERAFPIPIREWGHPRRLYTNQLIQVPWLLVEGENRRKIRNEYPKESMEEIDDTIVDDRLKDLGYK